MKIEKRIIPGLPATRTSQNRYVVAHEAGNPGNTGPDSLEREISFMTRNWRNAFTSHFVGGGGRIVQLAPSGIRQYGAGPKANAYCYAQVELARTKDPATFRKDYEAYVWLLRKLAHEAGLPVELDRPGHGIKSHEWITKNLGGSTHTDPFSYLASFGITRAQFAKDIKSGVGASTADVAGWYVMQGDTGARVLQLQQDLNKAGYTVAKDGIFGASTKTALLAFQRANGLASDGVYGAGSQAAMAKAIKEKEGNKPMANEKDAKPSASLAGEVARAISLGISDGTYPHRAMKREEGMAMQVRTFDAVMAEVKKLIK